MEIPIKMDDLGVPPFKETPICFFFFVWQVVEGKRTSVDLLLKKIRCGLALLASASQCRGD